MATDDTKTAKIALVNTPKPDLFLNRPDPLGQPINPLELVQILGGREALKEAFPNSFMVGDTKLKYAIIQTHDKPGQRSANMNHGIDAIAFRTTPSPYHYDVLYLRGCKTADAAIKEAEKDAEWANASKERRSELVEAYYEKAIAGIPEERLSGGFYAVTSAYGIAAWELHENIEAVTGIKLNFTDSFKESRAQCKQHIMTCDCEGCKAVQAEDKRLKSRFDPLPLLDVDRNIIPRPAATLEDTPTTADASKVSDALAKAQKLGWAGVVPNSVN